MPILDFKIQEQTRVIELVGDQISRRLLSIMGLWQIFKDGFFVLNDVTKAASFNTQQHLQRIPDNRCDVQIIPNYNPLEPALEGGQGKDVEASRTNRRWLTGSIGEYPLFYDKRANTYLFEVNVPTSVELEFTLKVKSVELADLITTALYAKSLSGGSIHDYNDVYFQYGIPDRSIILLYRIFKLQKDLEEFGFADYLKAGSNDQISALINRDQPETGPKQLIVQRSAVHVLGRLENDAAKPESEPINRSLDRLTLTFRYIFQFGRPIMMRAEYPIMINNELIGDRFIRKPLGMNMGDGPKYHPNRVINQVSMMNYDSRTNLNKAYPLVQFPDTDDFRPGTRMYQTFNSNYQHLFIGLLSIDIDPDDGSLSLDIDVRDEIFPLMETRITDEIERVVAIDYTTDQFQRKTDILRRLGIFNISIFSNENLVDYSQITFDDELNLVVNSTLDISKRYHIVISQVKDLKILNSFYIRHMLNFPEYYGDLLSVHFNYLLENRYIRVVREELTRTSSVAKDREALTTKSTNNSFRLGRYIVIPTY